MVDDESQTIYNVGSDFPQSQVFIGGIISGLQNAFSFPITNFYGCIDSLTITTVRGHP